MEMEEEAEEEEAEAEEEEEEGTEAAAAAAAQVWPMQPKHQLMTANAVRVTRQPWHGVWTKHG
jgi:hypothetical protein